MISITEKYSMVLRNLNWNSVMKYLLLMLVILFIACGVFDPEPLDNFALFASIDGNPRGLWIFDANTFEKIDSLEMDWVPLVFDISDDNSTWYSTLNNKDIIAIDANTKAIDMQITTRNYDPILDWQKKHIITYYGSDYIQFYDVQTFELVYEDSLGLGWEGIRMMVASPIEDKVYAFHISEQGTGIMIYNTLNYQIEQVIELSDNIERNRGMSPTDISVSPDGNYLFITVYNWSDPNAPSWYGSFHVIDLSANQVVAEYSCGTYAQMGVSPDGSYIYLSDPAGYLIESHPSNQVLRYDITSQTMEVFIDGPADIGLKSSNNDNIYFITDQIIIAPDNRTMFITLGGAVTTATGKDIHMAKIDIRTKKVLEYFAIPRDYRGYITSEIRKLKLNKYMSQSE